MLSEASKEAAADMQKGIGEAAWTTRSTTAGWAPRWSRRRGRPPRLPAPRLSLHLAHMAVPSVKTYGQPFDTS
nr:unnamed protein product [Haemonchus contortus]